ncbi:MAG: type VI secretion system tip protein VgrG [Bacteroidetes bacterium]|nr:type VI secretion system tip protein VgrG [Bacteroidota bacterium]
MASGTNSGGIATFVVKTSGNAVPDELRILKIQVEKSVNRISSAIVTILDGDVSTGKFEASSSADFAPGTELTIEAGYDAKNTLIFKGIITRQTIRIDELVGSVLEVECRDESIKMVVGRKSLTFSKKKDSDIIQSIIGTYSGLTADVTATETTWPEQVQYYVSDWDFILARAEANGLIITTLNGKVSVVKPDASTTSVLTVTYGDGLMTFNADLNALTQLGSVKATAWDYKNQAVTTGQSSNSYSGPGNLTAKKLSDVAGLSDFQVQTTVPLESADLTNWSKAQLVKSDYSKITGEAKFQGSSLVDPGKYMTFQGIGDRFNGDYLVAGVVHDLSDGNWLTEVKLGMSPQWFTEEPDVMAPPASGLLPGASGLFNGTVKKIYEDPDSQYRILVNVPLFDQNGEGIWARLTNFYSTSGAGVFFLPEVGDEVVLGFLNEDPRYPIILGSMYSSSKLKPFQGLDPNEKNSIKAIVSKKGISVQFDDENTVLTITTPKKNTFILSDKEGQISLKDQNENSVVMSSSGITLKSPKSITIQADEKVNITGTQGVSIQASGGDVSISGINIKETADSEYSAAGNATAKVTSGAELSLKSAMIMIN